MDEKLACTSRGGGSGITSLSPTGFASTFCSFSSVETAVKCCSCFLLFAFTSEFSLCQDLAHSQPFTEQF